MDLKESLKQFGLSNTESKIYLALLKFGESTTVTLSKETGIHRRTIYDNLDILIKKGFVGFILKEKIKYFKASNPHLFKTILDEKKDVLSTMLPALLNYYNSYDGSPEIIVYSGIEGAKSLLEEVSNLKKTVFWVGTGGLLLQTLKNSSKRIVKNKLDSFDLKMVHPYSRNIFPDKNTRILPKKLSFASTMSFAVYGDSVAIGLIDKEDFTVIRIKSEGFSKGFKNYFDVMWTCAKK